MSKQIHKRKDVQNKQVPAWQVSHSSDARTLEAARRGYGVCGHSGDNRFICVSSPQVWGFISKASLRTLCAFMVFRPQDLNSDSLSS